MQPTSQLESYLNFLIFDTEYTATKATEQTALLPLPRRLCYCRCLSVSNFVQKLLNRFA